MAGHYLKLSKLGVKLLSVFPKFLIRFILNIFQNTGGYIGLGIRYSCIYNLIKNCGENVAIFPYVILKNIENLSIGSNVSIHSFSYIDASGGINIGNNVSIAHNSSLISFTHTWDDPHKPIKYNPCKNKPIIIENDIWIGCGTRIIGDCRITKRNIIGAGSVIKGATSSNHIYAGIPARIVKDI